VWSASSAKQSRGHWSVGEKECYGIFYGVRLFEDNILKTDHKNLTYLNITLTGKVLRWKLYLQDKDFSCAMFLESRFTKECPTHSQGYVKTTCQQSKYMRIM
jgi:hypothetical protein